MSYLEIINTLKEFKAKHAQKYGILTLGIFGSVVRNTMKQESDIDVVVKMKNQDLFNMIGIKQDLEETFHVPVDVISYREKMNDFLKNRIDKETIYV